MAEIDLDKRIKALNKKLKQIDGLKEKPKDQLDAAAREKIASETDLRNEVAELERQLAGGSPAQEQTVRPGKEAKSAESGGAFAPPPRSMENKDPHAQRRSAELEPPPADLGLLIDDETEKRFKALQKKLRDIGKLREKDKLDKLQEEKLGQELGVIEELAELRKKATAKLEERRKSMAAKQRPSKNADGQEAAQNVAREDAPAWECPNCGASGGVEDLMSGADLCPKCGYDGIRHNAPGRAYEEEEDGDDLPEVTKAKVKDFESKDLKTARQRAQPATKKKDEEVKASPASAKWPEVKEVLESGDCGVDKGRQKKAIAVDRPKPGSPYDSFDPVLLKCSFLTRVELKLPPGVLASDDFMLFFPGPLSENLVELILKENKLPNIPPGIKELKRIRSMDLSQNALTSLGDDDIWKSVSTSLELLDLSFNQLDDVSSLSPLVKLSQIKLNANKLTSLDGINWKELKQLSIVSAVGNELKELSGDIGEFAQSLEHLEVSENKLTALPPNLCDLKKVKVLAVSGNPIKDQKALKAAEKGAKDLKTYLSKMKGSKK
mmetsp:Transcript_40641/g.73189  ORF Transcript_40641/g.73189 Transcript_40641/m.73189 type:complete len:551 (+) Transcript_40641:70-1722(+)